MRAGREARSGGAGRAEIALGGGRVSRVRARDRRTVVAFANTCCIICSFSAGESLETSIP